MKRKILTITGVVVLSIVFALAAFTQGYAKYGLTEEEIRTVQTKLVNWGYFDGPVDGKYGPKTTGQSNTSSAKTALR